MNFLKKKLKPLASGLTNNQHKQRNKGEEDLEDDLYHDYVVEAPPHPSELEALGLNPNEYDLNDPEQLKEIYKKIKDKKANSVLIARQRQKEEIEEKKKTRAEWQFFDSLTARVEQVVKDSQKNLDHLKQSSAIEKLSEPEYELRLTPDQVFKSSSSVKQEKNADDWIDFNDDRELGDRVSSIIKIDDDFAIGQGTKQTDFGECSHNKDTDIQQRAIVEELFEDFGFDLRPAEERKASPTPTRRTPTEIVKTGQLTETHRKPDEPKEVDPFDTSFVSESPVLKSTPQEKTEPQSKSADPFDTSYVNL